MKGKAVLIFALLLTAACSAGPKERRPPDAGAPFPNVIDDDLLPIEAFALLTESAADSCAVCARELREKAFRILDDSFRPGRIVRSDESSRFVRVAGGAHELILSSWPRSDPWFTFRFHTTDDRLVGIAETDLTDRTIADRCLSFPEGAFFHGAVKIIPFAYGDGAAWLYYPSNNHLQVHCRIVQIAGE